jgi:NADH-quinone oxidoreductase subunit G
VYRYVPRQNDAVNSAWMCDAGRLNYAWINRRDRLRKVTRKDASGGAAPAGWADVLPEIARRLQSAPAGSVAVVASARQTNEELFLLKELADRLGAVTDSVPRFGDEDALLVSADKNPNSNGVRLMGLSFTEAGIRLPKIAEGIWKGEIRTLIVLGEDVTLHGFGQEVLAKLELLVVSDILPSITTGLAHYLLPGCAHAEKRGSYVNVKGRVQRFVKAVEPPGDARPEGEVLAELLSLLTGETVTSNIEGLFNRMARKVPAFHNLSWAGLGDTGVTIPV